MENTIETTDAGRGYKAGDRVRVTKLPHERWTRVFHVGLEFTIERIGGSTRYGPTAYDESGSSYIPVSCLEPVAAAAPPATAWDSDKYNGVVSSNLDQRIAAARVLLDRPAPDRFPHEGRSDRVSNYRRWK